LCGARERGFDISLADCEGADEIGIESVVNYRHSGAQRLLRIDDGGERIEIESNQLRRIFGRAAAFGHDDGHGLADMPHFIVRQQRLLGVDELVLNKRRPFARQ